MKYNTLIINKCKHQSEKKYSECLTSKTDADIIKAVKSHIWEIKMKKTSENIIADTIRRYPVLEKNREGITAAAEILINAYKNGNKVLTCGNGGSASDALHIVGELMKGFVLPRKPDGEMKTRMLSECGHGEYLAENLQGALPAISLVNEAALLTAYANDVAPDLNFAQQVYGHGKSGDVLIAISTSGNSKNVIYASELSGLLGLKVIGLTGETGGKMKNLCDALINVPEKETYKIQELHLPVYHALCLIVENEFFGE